jgi:hypothetical protein
MTAVVAAVTMVSGAALAGDVGGEVEQREATATRRFEVSLAPAVVQVNGLFTQHVGTFGTFSWRVHERVAVQLLAGGNWYSDEAPFNAELASKFHVESQAASSQLWTWGALAGTELEPFFGELALFGSRARAGVVLGAGLGAGGTRHRLSQSPGEATRFGDTGTRFMAAVAVGLRLRVGDRFVARLELRDVFHSAAMSTVNGCTLADARGIVSGLLPSGPVSPGCALEYRDAPLAMQLLQTPTSSVLHHVGVSVAAGFVF